MTKEVSSVIQNIVDNIDCTIVGTFDVETGRTYCCKTKWARVGKVCYDDQNKEWTITQVVDDQYIVGIGQDGQLEGVITLNTPYWLTGTKISANREWTIADSNLLNKTPLVWLLELIKYKSYGRGSTLDWESELRIFVLDETNPTDFYVADHRSQVVLPMENLVSEIVKVIQNSPSFVKPESFDVYSFSRFGVEKEQGMFQNILDANLSGVELRINLKKYKENCKC